MYSKKIYDTIPNLINAQILPRYFGQLLMFITEKNDFVKRFKILAGYRSEK